MAKLKMELKTGYDPAKRCRVPFVVIKGHAMRTEDVAKYCIDNGLTENDFEKWLLYYGIDGYPYKKPNP